MLTYKIHLFRHGITRANLEGKYVGLSDYPLCQEGIDALKEFVKDKDYPPVEKIYTSPLRRCRETAHILYPGYKYAQRSAGGRGRDGVHPPRHQRLK